MYPTATRCSEPTDIVAPLTFDRSGRALNTFQSPILHRLLLFPLSLFSLFVVRPCFFLLFFPIVFPFLFLLVYFRSYVPKDTKYLYPTWYLLHVILFKFLALLHTPDRPYANSSHIYLYLPKMPHHVRDMWTDASLKLSEEKHLVLLCGSLVRSISSPVTSHFGHQ